MGQGQSVTRIMELWCSFGGNQSISYKFHLAVMGMCEECLVLLNDWCHFAAFNFISWIRPHHVNNRCFVSPRVRVLLNTTSYNMFKSPPPNMTRINSWVTALIQSHLGGRKDWRSVGSLRLIRCVTIWQREKWDFLFGSWVVLFWLFFYLWNSSLSLSWRIVHLVKEDVHVIAVHGQISFCPWIRTSLGGRVEYLGCVSESRISPFLFSSKFFIEFRTMNSPMARVHLDKLPFDHVRGHYCSSSLCWC